VNLLELIHRHQIDRPAGERSEEGEGSPSGQGVRSLVSLPSQPPAPVQTDAERCLTWLTRYVRGRYPRLADVRAAARAAGFGAATLDGAIRQADFVVYRTFPRRNAPEIERIRSVDDWPDDPPLAAR